MDYGKTPRITKKIRVFGIVQGVGFRPLVYRIAKKHELTGTVQNIGGLVEIIVQGYESVILDFLGDLKKSPPKGSVIIHIEIEDIHSVIESFPDFKIIESCSLDEVVILPPDLSVCPDCTQELYTETDRRFQNPFISCMSCGPRYTIMENLPYDRHTTTMRDFKMCSSCNEEYISPNSRRFHAQTISCNDCGPYLIYHGQCPAGSPASVEYTPKTDPQCIREFPLHREISQELYELDAFEAALTTLKSGGILAVKGIGGYHFACSPFIQETVENLRKLKGREYKPFAVMFENLESVKKYCFVSEQEKDLLLSDARPIVLLFAKEKTDMASMVGMGSIYCGAFLPYTPLQLLLIKSCGPLIMTSANISNRPIIRNDEEILSLSSPYLNGILYNKRRIVRSVDDSVMKIINKKPQLIRRSRGFVPYPVFLPQSDENPQIFAAGGDLKAAFCLYKKGAAVVSQHFGDLEELTMMEEYTNAYHDLTKLLTIKPTLAVCDLHPNYYSSSFTKALGIPVKMVQHHHAHIASVMAEHNLKGQIIGISFDGTGYGTDGNIWGGEFLVCEGSEFVRAAHLNYTPMLGGDQSMKDAKKTASCFLIDNDLEEYCEDERKALIKAALETGINTILSSSMGRLFDAVAALLNIGQENRYEGECAALLEREALMAIWNLTKPEELTFAISQKSEIIEIDPRPLLEKICRLREVKSKSSLALGYHYAVADMILKVCEILRSIYHTNTVALSGGVFQNTILTEKAIHLLTEKGYQVYINISVPPNDGAISLGQTYLGLFH